MKSVALIPASWRATAIEVIPPADIRRSE